MTTLKPIPITVFTGFLGSGKTSIILSLLPQLPKDYKVVLLKNEFGDVEVDSQLAKQSSLTAVSEILNGCMCCVLVGQMQNALLEIREKYRPDRIIIECSGSAFPATLAFQIRELERETKGDLLLDAIVTVIDAENFRGYEDTSPTARMQSSYTDVIVINKWEHISERALEDVVDHLSTLNDTTPKIKCIDGNKIDPTLIFGLETSLFSGQEVTFPDGSHNDEVETITVYSGSGEGRPEHSHSHAPDDHCAAVDVTDAVGVLTTIRREDLIAALESLSKESVWRVKGFVNLENEGFHILNWAFGRQKFTVMHSPPPEGFRIKFTVMGERGEVKRAVRKFCAAIDARIL